MNKYFNLYLYFKTSQNLRRVKLDMLVRLAKAISMLSFVPNTFYFMIKSKSAKFIVVVVV